MQNHTKQYFEAYKIDYDPVTGWHDYIKCEVCHNEAVDIHHIERRMKGNKKLDEVSNCIALCRECHIKAHANKWGYDTINLKVYHENNMRIHGLIK